MEDFGSQYYVKQT